MYFANVPTLADWKTFTGRGAAVPIPKGPPKSIDPEILKLDELIQRYNQAMPMARVNALNDMTPLISTWLSKHPKPAVSPFAPVTGGNLYDAMVALREVVARRLKLAVPNTSLYHQVVCLGYSIQTGTVRNYWDPKGAAWKSTAAGYMGDKDPKVDLKKRCDQMIVAVKSAYALNQHKMVATKKVADDSRTLKIFMAPEFFFRGVSGAFTMNYLLGDKGEYSILDTLRAETKQAQYASWLFVFGTFIAGTERTRLSCQTCMQWMAPEMVPALGKKLLTCPTCKKYARCPKASCQANSKSRGFLTVYPGDVVGARRLHCEVCKTVYPFCEHCIGVTIDNYALIQKGGHSQGDGVHDYITQKAYVSNLDFDEIDNQAPKVRIFGREEEYIEPRSDPGSASERMGGSVFHMDGITFGIEVCLDHLAGRLAADADRGRIQIQLIPSAGAYINKTNGVACVSNGILFNVDGGGGAQISVAVNAPGGVHDEASVGELPVINLSAGLFPPGNQKVQIFGPFAMPPA